MKLNSYYNITALGTYLPIKRLTNYDLEKMVDTNDEWIVKRTGIKERRIAAVDEYASDLAIKAVQNMLDNNDVDLNDVDFIIATPFVSDHLTPSVAAMVSGHFGMKNAGTFDLHSACTGFAYGFITANSFLLSGQAKKVLLISAEVPSKVVDYTDRGTCILFGDAATAMLIEKSAKPKFFASHFGTDGFVAENVYCSHVSSVINGKALDKAHLIQQNGRFLYEYVVKNISLSIQKLLDKAQLCVSDINWFIPHSANLRMIHALSERLGFDIDKTLSSIEMYGNTSSSTIPLSISMAIKDNKLKKGDKLLLYGFGGGITHAGVIIEW